MSESAPSSFISCGLCPCIFCIKADFDKHMVAFGKGDEHKKKFEQTHKHIEHGGGDDDYKGGWKKSKYDDSFWCYVDDDPRLASDLMRNGNVTMGGFDYSMNGKYIKKRLSKM